MVVSNILFAAQWTPAIQKATPQHSPINKVCDFVKRSIFFIPNRIIEPLVRWAILPSSSPFMRHLIHSVDAIFKQTIPAINADPNSKYETSELSVKTPDGIELKGHFAKHKDHDQHPDARVVIMFHGNGDFYQSQSYLWLVEEVLEDSDTPYSLLLFNPRGVGASQQGIPNATNLLIDAESIYQAVRDQLGVSEDKIDMYGHSLGGAQAARLKALHPNTGGRLFLDRTFSSLNKMIDHIFGYRYLAIFRWCIQKLIKSYDWELDTYKALTPIEDRVHIFTHLQDRIIPTACSVGEAVQNLNPHPTTIATHRFTGQAKHAHVRPIIYAQKEGDIEGDTRQLLIECFNHHTYLVKKAQ